MTIEMVIIIPFVVCGLVALLFGGDWNEETWWQRRKRHIEQTKQENPSDG